MRRLSNTRRGGRGGESFSSPAPRFLLGSALLLLALGGLGGSALAEELSPVKEEIKLSNETTRSVWAHPADTQSIRSSPSNSAKKVAKLRLNTEDGLPEVYLALRQRQVKGVDWVEIRVPKKPNGVTGWVHRDHLGEFNTVSTQLVVDRQKMSVTLYKKGRKIFSARAGVGKKSTPTPAGRFYVREGFPNGGAAVYGKYVFGLSAYSTKSDFPGSDMIGIHGTNQPGLIPGRPSAGCVRLTNKNILRLKRLMPIGTAVHIK